MSTVVGQMHLVCYDYIAPFMCSMGIFTNILNLIVLTRPSMKGSAYTFLTALAVTDMGILLIFFTYIQVSSKAGSVGTMAYWWTLYNVYVVNPSLHVFCSASVWIITLITIDRWLFVRWPLLAKSFCSRKYARRKVLLAFVLALAFNSLRLSQYAVIKSTVNGTVITEVKATRLRWSSQFSVFFWIYAVVVMYIPSCLLLVANSYLLIHLRHVARQRLKMMPSSRIFKDRTLSPRSDNSRLTASLIAITFLFVICIVPSSFSEPSIAYTLFGQGKMPMEFFAATSYRVSIIVANMLVLCNASLNFFMYCVFNHKFSKTMQQVLWIFIHRLTGRFNRKNSQTVYIIGRPDKYFSHHPEY